MKESLLPFYMGYAFSHAVNVQNLIEPPELMVPYVVYWEGEQPTPVPYPASTQAFAIEKACAAREQRAPRVTGWASGREGTITFDNDVKHDVLLIEGWVPGLSLPLEMFTCCRKAPFRLLNGFVWKNHSQVRRTKEETREFMKEFKRGILSQPFGQQCLEYIERSEPVQIVPSKQS